MTKGARQPFRNAVLNQPRDRYPPLAKSKKAPTMLERRQFAQQCWHIDQADNQTMRAALLDEYGIDMPNDAATVEGLDRLVHAMALDSRPIPFGRRCRSFCRPIENLLPIMEQLADYIEECRENETEPNVMARCRQFKKHYRDKRSAKYLREQYKEYRRYVQRAGANQHARKAYFDRLSDGATWWLSLSPSEAAMEPDRYLNKSETAAFFGVSTSAISAWVAAGRLPAPELLPNGRPRWRINTLRSCIKSAAAASMAAT